MKRSLILHDLSPDDAKNLLPVDSERCTLFYATPPVHHCVGCFGCWIKTPGRCVIQDRGAAFTPLTAAHDELILVSRLVFGGLSPDVKAVMDRSIGYLLPFFRIVKGEMHHSLRYENPLDLRYIFYGSDIRDAERETARKLSAANALNFGARSCVLCFASTVQEIKDLLNNLADHKEAAL
jgi:hypothetical protein